MTDRYVKHPVEPGGTSSTLLVRIRAKDQEAWERLVYLYSPLVRCWCRRFGLQEADTADVTQDVFRIVSEAIERFHHDREGGTFRGWLRTITRNRVIDLLRKAGRGLDGVGGSDAQARLLEVQAVEPYSGSSDEDDGRLLVRRVVDQVLSHSKEENRQAFLRVVIGGQHPKDVAQDLGMTVNAVYLAKCHILRRIRVELDTFVDI